MRFTYFKFENFKGIENEKLDLSKNPHSNIFTLVGLNESGKTTILEAINYFAYKPEKLDGLDLQNYEVSDIHNLIPINKRDNFNGIIHIEAGIELSDENLALFKRQLSSKGHNITSFDKKIVFIQKYHFENSIHVVEKDEHLWIYDIQSRKKNAKKSRKLNNDDALFISRDIKQNMPSILYFPNFLFEFPEKIYLDKGVTDKKHKFYQKIVQDILDSLENDTNIEEHLIKRIESSDTTEKRNLTSLIGKMQKKLTDQIFAKWNLIFNKKISKTEIILLTGSDDEGTYLEFNIKDDVDTYRIVERSLGFRWFFVYILLTQFREYRKENKNALFLFDEPASNLHPSAQTELLKSFEKLPSVIYTTHSHYLINPKWLESTFVIKNEAIDYDNEESYVSKNTKIQVHKYREFSVKHPNQSSYFQPILEVLDFRPSQLDLVPKVILTEGKNDFYTLNYFSNIIIPEFSHLKFIPGTSASNLETLISLYLGWGSKFRVLLDSDKEGRKQKTRYNEIFGISLTNLICTLEDINNIWSNYDLENLIDVSDQSKIVEAIYGSDVKFTKTLINRSIQEMYINNTHLSLTETTVNNFRELLSSLNKMLNEE